jgi:anti-sigma factor RsiW
MECSRIKKRLSAYLDGEVSEDERITISEHLGQCDACQKELTSLSKVVDVLGRIEEMEVPPYFMTRLKQQVRAQVKPKPFFQRIRSMVLSAATAIAVVVSILAGSQMGRTIYQAITQTTELNQAVTGDVFGVGAFEEFPVGSLSDIYNELITGGNNG